MKLLILALCGALCLAACQSGDIPGGAPAPEGATASPAATPAASTAAHAPDTAHAATKPGASEVDFPDAIQWHTWEEGLALAKTQNKPMMVVVYADWCPKCRALSPVFASTEIAELAKKLVVVRQNHDDNPEWLARYNEKFGGYVPRIFFFDAKGNVREDVTSGHPRYPFFYAAQQPDFLKRAMQQAIGS